MNDQNGVNQLFDGASSLNQDLSYWCFPANQNIYNNRNNIWGNNNPIKSNAHLGQGLHLGEQLVEIKSSVKNSNSFTNFFKMVEL